MATLVRVLQQPDGSLLVIHPAMNDRSRPPGIPDDVWARARLDQTLIKHPEWQGLPAVDVQSDTLPTDRTLRDKWRLTGRTVRPDPAVPDRPHPRQGLLDAVDRANTVPELKVVLRQLLRGA